MKEEKKWGCFGRHVQGHTPPEGEISAGDALIVTTKRKKKTKWAKGFGLRKE